MSTINMWRHGGLVNFKNQFNILIVNIAMYTVDTNNQCTECEFQDSIICVDGQML